MQKRYVSLYLESFKTTNTHTFVIFFPRGLLHLIFILINILPVPEQQGSWITKEMNGCING